MKSFAFTLRFILFALFLFSTGCAAPTPSLTSTPPATQTSIPTLTPATTPTPAEAPIPAGLTEFVANIKDGYTPHWKGESIVLVDKNTNLEVPELTFDKDGINYTRTYLFDMEGYESKDLTVYGTVKEIGIIKDGDATTLDFPGWRFEGGNWVRETVIAPDGKETELVKPSKDEVVEMIFQDTELVKAKLIKDMGKERGDAEFLDIKTQTRLETVARLRELLGLDNATPTIRYEGMQYYTGLKCIGRNQIYFIDNLFIVTNDVPTMFYAYDELRDFGQTFVTWKDVSGVQKKYIIDAMLGQKDYPITVLQVSSE
jgi:hypothetical protein